MLELVLTHPSYRQNVATFLLLYAVGGAISLAISLPLAIKHRRWRSILWMPTWFAFAFLRRLAALEAVISLPTRPISGSWATAITRAGTGGGGLGAASRRIRPSRGFVIAARSALNWLPHVTGHFCPAGHPILRRPCPMSSRPSAATGTIP